MRPFPLVLFMVFGCSGSVSAQETEVAQLNARVRVLEERLAEVEAKLAAVEVRPHGVQGGALRSSSETTPPQCGTSDAKYPTLITWSRIAVEFVGLERPVRYLVFGG